MCPGVKNLLPTSCSSHLGFEYRPARHASTCRNAHAETPGDQRLSTFVRNHAAAILACDFCVVVTATFRSLYVLVVIEHQTRRMLSLTLSWVDYTMNMESLNREALKNFLSNVIGQVTLDPATHECQINYRIGINLGDKMASPRGVELIPRIVIM